MHGWACEKGGGLPRDKNKAVAENQSRIRKAGVGAVLGGHGKVAVGLRGLGTGFYSLYGDKK